jgi:hypothetical protein
MNETCTLFDFKEIYKASVKYQLKSAMVSWQAGTLKHDFPAHPNAPFNSHTYPESKEVDVMAEKLFERKC